MYKSLVARNIVHRVATPMKAEGWFLDTKTNKYSCEGRVFQKDDPPWYYVNPVPDTPCAFYQKIADYGNFIPSPCLDCWKVVVSPRFLTHLFEVLRFQLEFTKDHLGTGHFCKCGIDERDYTGRSYGGFFYCMSKEHALHRWEQVRQAVDDIDSDIDVSVVRYCTEFNIKYGPSDEYEWAPGTDALETMVFDAFDLSATKGGLPQSQMVRDGVTQKWIEFAWSRADPTAIAYNDNEPIVPASVTYHPKTTEEA